MAPTVLVSATKLTATINVAAHTLELHAEGEKPLIGPPQFKQIPWVEGWRFRLAGLYLGPGIKAPMTPYKADYKMKFVVPNTWVVRIQVETADGTKDVPIQYVGAPGPVTTSNGDDVPHFIDVLPPISLAIEGPFSNIITAQVPSKQDNIKSSVHIDYNDEFVKVLSTTAEDGTIKWVIAWNPDHYPVGQGQSPQLIEVTTYKVWRNGSEIESSRVVQPYLVSFTNIPPSTGTGSSAAAVAVASA